MPVNFSAAPPSLCRAARPGSSSESYYVASGSQRQQMPTYSVTSTSTVRHADSNKNSISPPARTVPAVHVVDLCCGMGGLSLAATDLKMKVVAGVDTSPVAVKTFSRNFPSAKGIEGSVRSSKVLRQCAALLRPEEPPLATVVISGPPCQGFSAAGSRDPGDPRNRVLVAVARAIVQLEPDCAIIENVATVLAGKHGNRIGDFRDILVAGGYRVLDVLLDSSEFGLPQKRKRAFFLVTQNQLARGCVHTLLEQHKSPPMTTEAAFLGLPTPAVRPAVYDDEADCEHPTNHFAMRHSEAVIEKISAIPPGTGPMSYRRLHPVRPANTLFSGHRAPPAHFSEPRSITVREAARLQGFPDSFRVYGTFANQMEQVTNAVPPPLARAVLNVLVDLTGLRCKIND